MFYIFVSVNIGFPKRVTIFFIVLQIRVKLLKIPLEHNKISNKPLRKNKAYENDSGGCQFFNC